METSFEAHRFKDGKSKPEPLNSKFEKDRESRNQAAAAAAPSVIITLRMNMNTKITLN